MALNLELDVSIVRNGTRMMVVDETGASLKTGDGKWNEDRADQEKIQDRFPLEMEKNKCIRSKDACRQLEERHKTGNDKRIG